MRTHNKTPHVMHGIAAGLLWGMTVAAGAETYYEHVPVLDVTPIVEGRGVPVQERICARDERDRRGAWRAVGDVRSGRPQLSISAAVNEDRQFWAGLSAEEDRCGTVKRYRHRHEIAGYRVEYAYGSERLVTRMDHDPGERIRIRVQLSPVDREDASWAGSFRPSGRSRYR